MAGFLGAGDVYINRQNDNGVYEGWVQLGNAVEFSIEEAAERKDRVSRRRDTYGNVLDSVSIKQPGTLNIVVDELDIENLALALMGAVTKTNQVSGNKTDVITAPKPGKFVELSFGEVTSVVVTVGEDTLVAGTDYKVIPHIGMLQILEGGGISEGDSMSVQYNYGAYTKSLLEGGTKTQIKCQVWLDGRNFADNSKVICKVKEAVLAPSGAVGFISEDFSQITLSGSLNVPEGETAGYTIEQYGTVTEYAG